MPNSFFVKGPPPKVSQSKLEAMAKMKQALAANKLQEVVLAVPKRKPSKIESPQKPRNLLGASRSQSVSTIQTSSRASNASPSKEDPYALKHTSSGGSSSLFASDFSDQPYNPDSSNYQLMTPSIYASKKRVMVRRNLQTQSLERLKGPKKLPPLFQNESLRGENLLETPASRLHNFAVVKPQCVLQ